MSLHGISFTFDKLSKSKTINNAFVHCTRMYISKRRLKKLLVLQAARENAVFYFPSDLNTFAKALNKKTRRHVESKQKWF